MAPLRSNGKRLNCIPGVGPLLATALVASVADRTDQLCDVKIFLANSEPSTWPAVM